MTAFVKLGLFVTIILVISSVCCYIYATTLENKMIAAGEAFQKYGFDKRWYEVSQQAKGIRPGHVTIYVTISQTLMGMALVVGMGTVLGLLAKKPKSQQIDQSKTDMAKAETQVQTDNACCKESFQKK
jgi:hypothetical protein